MSTEVKNWAAKVFQTSEFINTLRLSQFPDSLIPKTARTDLLNKQTENRLQNWYPAQINVS